MDSDSHTVSIRLFSTKAVGVSSFLGGPIAGALLIGVNYWRLGRRERAWATWALGVLATGLLFWGLFAVPGEIMAKVPRVLIPAVYTPLIVVCVQRLQGADIERARAACGRGASAWSAAGYATVGLIGALLVMIPFVLLVPPLDFRGRRFDFGDGGCHQIYCQGGIDEFVAQKVEAYLTDVGFFEAGEVGLAHIGRELGRCVITLPILRAYWNDPEVLGWLESARVDMQAVLGEEVGIVLVDEDFMQTYHKEL